MRQAESALCGDGGAWLFLALLLTFLVMTPRGDYATPLAQAIELPNKTQDAHLLFNIR